MPMSFNTHRNSRRKRTIAHLFSFENWITNQSKLGLGISNNSWNYSSWMYSNIDREILPAFEIHWFHKSMHFHSKISGTNWMMSIQQPRLNLLLCWLETSTSHVSLSNCLNLLKPKLITKLIKSIINLVQKLNKLLSSIIPDDIIKFTKFNENNADFIFFIINGLLVQILFPVTYQRWNKYVQDRFEFQELSDFSMTVHKLGFLLQLLNIHISRPN